MGEAGEEHRWHRALERLGPEIVRAKPEPGPAAEASPSNMAALSADESAAPEPIVDPSLHGEETAGAGKSTLQTLRYWAVVAGTAGVIAAVIGVLSLLPMAMR
jgi:hypothetical protein